MPPPLVWTDERERALAEVLGWTEARREWFDSVELAQILGVPVSVSSPQGIPEEITSPRGGELARPKGFWFTINAELVIYGATEPNAEVSIGGRRIQLRPDGTFSYRFALPDGQYSLSIVATAADGDRREAHLQFSRATSCCGEVGTHPQDPALKPPAAGNVG